MALKLQRESSPLQIASNTNSNGGQQVTKIISRNSIQSSSNFTPKSIASSAHNSLANQEQIIGVNTNSATTNGGQTFTSLSGGGLGAYNSRGHLSSSSASSNNSPNLIAVKPLQQKVKAIPVESVFPKPSYPYSCLIAMALNNSRRGSLPVSEIYSFTCEHFPYFKTAPSGWKNSVRHNLSMNKCFEKIEKPPRNGYQRKVCLWAMNPERKAKMDEEVLKWSQKDPMAVRNAMVYPENLELLERGEMQHGSCGDSDLEMDSQSEIEEEASDLEEPDIDDTLVDNMVVEEDVEEEMINAASIKSDDDHEDEICDVVVNRLSKAHRSSSSPATMGNRSTASTVNNGIITMSDRVQSNFNIENCKTLQRCTQPANHQSTATSTNSSSTSSSTSKLGPGIGGLTFANNITYNKLEQQTTTNLSQGSTIIAANGAMEREFSPLQFASNTNSNSGQQVTKIISRNSIQSSSNFTPKSIASSAHNSHANQQQINGVNTNSATTNGGQTFTSLSGGLGAYNSSGNLSSSSASSNNSPNLLAIKPLQQKVKAIPVESEFPRPSYSYSCLTAMALKNSRRGSLPVSEIYSFMCEHFPYFKTAPGRWKNSVRHNLSLNKCFEKIEKPPTNGNQRKVCLWAMNPQRIAKMDEEVLKWSQKDPMAIRNAMVYPENLELLERGEMKHGSCGDSDLEMDSQSEIEEEASDLEEPDVDDTLVDNMVVEEDVEKEMINNTASIKSDVDHEDEICYVVVNRLSKVHRSSSSPATMGNRSTVSTVNNGITTMSDSMQNNFNIEDSSGPTLDYYITDSLQEMLDVDIRSEVANVVGSTNDYDTCLGDLPTSLDQGADTLSLGTNKENSISTACWNTSSTFGLGSTNSSSSWFGASGDFFADVGACVNPISVMPLVSSSLIHMSPKTNLNANSLRSNSTPPPSPNVNDTKSHLTFSPAHIKISAHSIRNEQLTSHIPKQQIVAISSAVTSGTTAPATLATNSALQRKSSAVEAIKKDMGADLRKVVPVVSVSASASSSDNLIFKSHSGTASNSTGSTSNSITTFTNSCAPPANHQSIATSTNSSSTSSSTIKLGPGIGGLTFANNITYNKLKQQTTTKLSQGSTIIAANGAMALKRERESSPLQIASNTNSNGGQQVTKIISRNSIQSSSNFTPKSIASSAHNSYANQQQINGVNTNSATTNGGQTFTSLSGGLGAYNSSGNLSSSSASSNNSPNLIAVKPLQQKVKAIPVESEFPKPSYSYSCLIAMALKNSRRGSLPVSEIYSFMCEHFPYFKTAPAGWKNSVRHNLSLNKCFEKIEKPPTNGNQRKGCLWAMNPERIAKMDEEVLKWSRKDPMAIRNAMVYPENLELLERGEMKHGSSGDSDVEMDSQSEIEEASDLEEPEIDDTLVDNMVVEEDVEEEMINAASIKSEDDHEDEICDVVVNRFSKVHRSSSSPATMGNRSTASTVNNGITTVSDGMHRDFDIEVEDIYDAIDIDDDKEAVRMALSQSEIIELSPADYDIGADNHNSPKRARLNINYSIGPAGEIEKQMKNNQPQMHIQGIKKIVKVSNIQDLQQIQQQLQQQQIIVQTIGGGSGHHQIPNGQFTQFNGISSFNDHQNQRKMQIVNRTS